MRKNAYIDCDVLTLNRQKGVLSIEVEPGQLQESFYFLRNLYPFKGTVHFTGQEGCQYKLNVLV